MQDELKIILRTFRNLDRLENNSEKIMVREELMRDINSIVSGHLFGLISVGNEIGFDTIRKLLKESLSMIDELEAKQG